MNNNKIIIAVDGPSASGKGTLSRLIAQYYDYDYLDTGLLYRSIGYKTYLKDPHFLNPSIAIEYAQNFSESWLKDPALRRDEISQIASKVAAIPDVRALLIDFQKNFAKNSPKKGVVVDGRDIGTVIYPCAHVKLFVTAAPEKRAKRRLEDLKEKNINIQYSEVLSNIKERDRRDRDRAQSPLVLTEDYYVVDTTNATIDQCMLDIHSHIDSVFSSLRIKEEL